MGIKTCDVCGEPLFREIEVFGQKMVVRRACECRRKEIEEENKLAEESRIYNKARDILELGYLDKAYAQYTFASTDDKESKEYHDMVQYCDHWDKAKKVNRGIWLISIRSVGHRIPGKPLAVGFRAANDRHIRKSHQNLPCRMVHRIDCGAALHLNKSAGCVKRQLGELGSISGGRERLLIGNNTSHHKIVYMDPFQNIRFPNQFPRNISAEFTGSKVSEAASALSESRANAINNYYFSHFLSLP